MPDGIDVTPPEFVAFAGRVDTYSDRSAARTPAEALTTVCSSLEGSEVSAYVSALAERVLLRQRAVHSDLGHVANNTRTATNVIVEADEANARGIGSVGGGR